MMGVENDEDDWGGAPVLGAATAMAQSDEHTNGANGTLVGVVALLGMAGLGLVLRRPSGREKHAHGAMSSTEVLRSRLQKARMAEERKDLMGRI